MQAHGPGQGEKLILKYSPDTAMMEKAGRNAFPPGRHKTIEEQPRTGGCDAVSPEAGHAMTTRLELDILPQPDDTTCGPTCLHAIYRYFGDNIPLEQVIAENTSLSGRGTLAVFLACHALRRGYGARIYTYNLHVFDPTWFSLESENIRGKLRAQMAHKRDERLRLATQGYLEFLDLGGELRFVDLTIGLIRKYLRRSLPILTGLSSTYLYRTAREISDNETPDDVRGEPVGHFVVLHGYDQENRSVQVADPYGENPVADSHYYAVNIGRVLGAILLGVLTHDANLLILSPRRRAGVGR